MGSSCNKSNEITIEEPKRNDKKIFEKEILDPKFKDMPEWEGERYKGEGLKRMKGYKCE